MTPRVRRFGGVLLIVVPVLFNLFFTLLSIEFSYPDILREPAADILRRFDEGGTYLIALWYGFALTPLLFLPAALLLRHGFRATPDSGSDSALLDLAAPLAILASLTQTLGLIRWPFVVPGLADTYLDPASSDASRASALTVFEVFHRYAGVAVGEHLGYLFTGAWSIVIGVAMVSGSRFPTWLGWVGIGSAVGILIGLLEPAGIAVAGDITAFAYIGWSLWLIVTGVIFIGAHEAAPAGDAKLVRQQVGAPSVAL